MHITVEFIKTAQYRREAGRSMAVPPPKATLGRPELSLFSSQTLPPPFYRTPEITFFLGRVCRV